MSPFDFMSAPEEIDSESEIVVLGKASEETRGIGLLVTDPDTGVPMTYNP